MALQFGSARSRLFAKGRLPSGQMNKTESAFAAELERQRVAGLIQWWKFEGIKLRLADKTFLTVDFAVLDAEGYLQMIDVKGSLNPAVYQGDAKVKMQVAAVTYPFKFFVAVPRLKRDGGGFSVTDVSA